MPYKTLSRHLSEQQRTAHPIAPKLCLLIERVAHACKRISNATAKGALGHVLGSAGSENSQGEKQKKLDLLANEILVETNEWGGYLAAMASEEMAKTHPIP